MLHQEWAEFFPNSELGTNYSKKIQKLSSEDQNYYISFCNFGTLLTEGAINFTTSKDTTKTLIEDTDFYKCSNTIGRGGSLYFSTEGECVQNRICSLNSNSAKYNMYCYVNVSNIAKYKNKILNSSISGSGNLYKDKKGNIYLKNGEIEINSINISYTDLNSVSLFSMQNYISSSRASFSILSNNTDNEPSNIYIYFYSSSETLLIKSCNYLTNNLTAIICASNAYVHVVNCNFINNIGRNEYFYHDYSGNITIDGCYIDKSNPKITGKIYFTSNEAISYNKINRFYKS